MLGRGNLNSFTFRELKNNVKIRTMRGRSFWHGLNAPGERDNSRREETHKTCNALSVSQLSLCLHGKANVCAERKMKCDASSGQTRAQVRETLAEGGGTFLKWASMSGLLSHISVRRTTDVCRTPAGQADGSLAMKRFPDDAALRVGVKRAAAVTSEAGRAGRRSEPPAAATVYTHHGSSRSAGFLWLEGTFPSVLEPS